MAFRCVFKSLVSMQKLFKKKLIYAFIIGAPLLITPLTSYAIGFVANPVAIAMSFTGIISLIGLIATTFIGFIKNGIAWAKKKQVSPRFNSVVLILITIFLSVAILSGVIALAF